MPSKGDEEEEANGDDNKKRRKLQAIDYANTRVIEVYAHNDGECRSTIRRSIA